MGYGFKLPPEGRQFERRDIESMPKFLKMTAAARHDAERPAEVDLGLDIAVEFVDSGGDVRTLGGVVDGGLKGLEIEAGHEDTGIVCGKDMRR